MLIFKDDAEIVMTIKYMTPLNSLAFLDAHGINVGLMENVNVFKVTIGLETNAYFAIITKNLIQFHKNVSEIVDSLQIMFLHQDIASVKMDITIY